MQVTLSDFIAQWNKSHKRFNFSAQNAPITDRPTVVEVRYSVAKYQKFFSTENWDRLRGAIEAKSHGTMYVATDEYLFERGIIEIKIASSNHNYQERFIVGTLRWIGEEFFPDEEKSGVAV